MDFLIAARRLRSLQGSAIGRNAWICSPCRRAARWNSRRPLSSAAPAHSGVASGKPYYVTTPIFYVNADPHIGHMYSMVLADVLKRWQALLPATADGPELKRALLCTGTDEHGMKVQRAAALAGLPPKQFCDETAARFRKLAERCDIDNDFFIRTTDADHVDAVRHFWFLLREKGYIYEHKHSGWYCVSDETFYPEAMVEKRMAPMTGKPEMVSVETGNTVEWIEERNYHFRMTELKDRLLQFYDENKAWVLPSSRMAEVVHWVEHNLEDLSISRPSSRLEWGIPVPDDPSQTIYVWVDALINYLTKAGFPNWTPPRGAEEGGWPADVQVIGKDILRFHAVYWPALLLAVDIAPPRRILSHAHWTLGRKKMSKSIGNVVNPFFAMERFGTDAMRFYLVHDGGIANDSDYGNEHIVERYTKNLRFGLGNLVGRITRTSKWSVRDAVAAAADGVLSAGEGVIEEQSNLNQKLAGDVAAHMESLNPGAALREIMQAVHRTNKFLSDTAPWTLAEAKDEKTRQRLREIVYQAAESLRIAGILLQPFMPSKAGELLDVLGVAESRRTFAHARPGRDFEYGTPARPAGKGKYDGLFPPLPVEG